MRKMIYLAGPYTNPDPVINTHAAIKVGTWVYENTDWVPMIPHLTLLHHMVTPRPLEFWYSLDMHHMSRCDAVTRLPGKSSGADAEIDMAYECEMEVVPVHDVIPFAILEELWESRYA